MPDEISRLNVICYPLVNSLLFVIFTKQPIRATCAAATLVISRSEIVAVNLRARYFIFREEPANQRCRWGSLPKSNPIVRLANMLNPDRVLVGASGVICPLAVLHHLIDITVDVDHIMG